MSHHSHGAVVNVDKDHAQADADERLVECHLREVIWISEVSQIVKQRRTHQLRQLRINACGDAAVNDSGPLTKALKSLV